MYPGTSTLADQYALDCGIRYVYLHDYDTTHLAHLYDPPATKDGSGYYTLPFHAKSPQSSFKFGTMTLSINRTDMIVTDPQLPAGTCFSAAQSEYLVGRPILGDTFFRNVGAIHNQTMMQMQ